MDNDNPWEFFTHSLHFCPLSFSLSFTLSLSNLCLKYLPLSQSSFSLQPLSLSCSLSNHHPFSLSIFLPFLPLLLPGHVRVFIHPSLAQAVCVSHHLWPCPSHFSVPPSLRPWLSPSIHPWVTQLSSE